MGETAFNLLEYLRSKRMQEREHSSSLLWENLESGIWWSSYAAIAEPERSEKKKSIQYHHHHPAMAQFFIVLSGTVQQIKAGEIHNILQYGAARRASSIYRSVNRLFDAAPIDRSSPLLRDEMDEVNDSLLLIYVHIIGVLDALAVAFHRLFSDRFSDPEKNADLLKKKFRRELGNQAIDGIVNRNVQFLTRVKDELRNRFVHRVPPYVPPSILRKQEVARLNDLNLRHERALASFDFELARKIDSERDSLGTFWPWIAFVDSSAFMPLHLTVVDDVLRFQVTVLDILEELVPNLEFNT